MSNTIHVFDYLKAPQKYPPAAVCVVFGDEPFLKRLARKQLQGDVLGDDDDTPFTIYTGDSTEWRDVVDELSTESLFGGGSKRLAVVDEADPFVSGYRGQLETYVEKPRSSGILILDVSTWQSNTRLYKSVDARGLQIECRAPQRVSGKRKVLDEARLAKWLASWSKTQHQAELTQQAGALMLELVGVEFGLLDQELAKLALFAGPGGQITPEMVRDVVGGWKTKTTWELLDAACDGDADEALRQLEQLLQAGENPLALFGQIAWSMRRFAAATRIFQQAEAQGRRIPLPQALEQAGFRKWPKSAIENAQRQLLQMGRDRAGQLYQWLMDADLALKGTHSTPHRARLVLEQLFVKLAKQLGPRR